MQGSIGPHSTSPRRVADSRDCSRPFLRLAQQYVYPQAYVQPSLVLPSAVSPSVGSPYLDYSAAYAQYAQAAFEQYPYAASPGFLGYSYAPGPAATPTQASATPAGAGSSPAFLQYAPQQHVQPDRMQ